MKKSKQQNLNIFSITKQTWEAFQPNWLKIIILTAIVTVPASLVRIIQLDSTTDASIIATFAGLFLTVTLFWSFAAKFNLKKISVFKAYVLASSRILPFILANIILSILALPLIFGFLIVTLALSTDISAIFILVGIAMMLLGIFVLVRSSLVTIIAALEDTSAFTAFRASWKITRKKFFKVLINWLYVFLIIIVMSGIILTVLLRITAIAQSDIAQSIISGILLVGILPFIVGYSAKLYERLL